MPSPGTTRATPPLRAIRWWTSFPTTAARFAGCASASPRVSFSTPGCRTWNRRCAAPSRAPQSLGAEVKPVRVPDMAALNAVGRVILLAEASAVLEPHLGRPRAIRRGRAGAARPGPPGARHRLHQRAAAAPQAEPRIRQALVGSGLPASLPPRPTPPRASANDRPAGRTGRGCAPGHHAPGARHQRAGASGAFDSLRTDGRAGLPIGIQIVGPALEEALILRVGAALEDGGVGIPPCPAAEVL